MKKIINSLVPLVFSLERRTCALVDRAGFVIVLFSDNVKARIDGIRAHWHEVNKARVADHGKEREAFLAKAGYNKDNTEAKPPKTPKEKAEARKKAQAKVQGAAAATPVGIEVDEDEDEDLRMSDDDEEAEQISKRKKPDDKSKGSSTDKEEKGNKGRGNGSGKGTGSTTLKAMPPKEVPTVPPHALGGLRSAVANAIFEYMDDNIPQGHPAK